MSTYGYDFLPVINEAFLAEFVFRFGAGRFASPDFCRRALVFEPAIDPIVFRRIT